MPIFLIHVQAHSYLRNKAFFILYAVFCMTSTLLFRVEGWTNVREYVKLALHYYEMHVILVTYGGRLLSVVDKRGELLAAGVYSFISVKVFLHESFHA